MLNLLLKDLINRISAILQDINQVHNLLFSEFEVVNLIVKDSALSLHLTFGLD